MRMKEETRFVIISFPDEIIDGNVAVELVPRSWLNWNETSWYTRFPAKNCYKHITNWVKYEVQPDDHWDTFKVDVVVEADNYDQDLRRLERSYVKIPVPSATEATDNESRSGPSMTSVSAALAKELMDMDNLPSVVEDFPEELQHKAKFPHPAKRKCATNSSESDIQTLTNTNTETIVAIEQYKENEVNRERRTSTMSSSREHGRETQGMESERRPVNSFGFFYTDNTYREFEIGMRNFFFVFLWISEEMAAPIFKKQEESESRIMKKIDSTKRSILYDINVKIGNVITNIHSATGIIHGIDVAQHESVLGVQLPVQTLEDFNELEIKLGEAEKKTAMKTIMSAKILSKTQMNAALGKILSHTIAKNVQLQYSAYGRETIVVGKKVKKINFSMTHTCKCMLEVLGSAYKVDDKSILSSTSRWLSGAGDRDHGRLKRHHNAD